MASLRSLPVHWSRDTFATCIPVTILPSWHHITVVSKLWGCFLKGRLFFLLEWLGYKASAALGKEDDGYASKRTWGLLQKSVTVSQNQLMKWTSWVSCARGRCLAKSPFEKTACFYRSKKWQYLNSLAREWLPDTVPPVPPSAWGLWLCPYPHPALAAELGVFFGENLSRIWPAESYHLHLPLCPCCESPVNDHTTGRVSPSHTSAGFGTAMLCKDASKEAQTGGWYRLGHRTVGQALCKKLSPHIRKGGIALSNLKKCKDKQILKSQRNSSFEFNFQYLQYMQSECHSGGLCLRNLWCHKGKKHPISEWGFATWNTWPILLFSKEMPRKSRASITMKKVQPSSFHKQQVLPELNEGREVWQVYKHHSEKGSCFQENLNYFKILVPFKNYMVVYTRKNMPVLLFK